MNLRQQFFVLEYLLDLDATAAAIRAGYSPFSAHRQASKLLRQPEIANAIREAMAERARRTGITREAVLDEYAKLVFIEMQLISDWDVDAVSLEPLETSEDTEAAVAFLADLTGRRGRHLPMTVLDKRKALEFLARILGLNVMQPERRELPHA